MNFVNSNQASHGIQTSTSRKQPVACFESDANIARMSSTFVSLLFTSEKLAVAMPQRCGRVVLGSGIGCKMPWRTVITRYIDYIDRANPSHAACRLSLSSKIEPIMCFIFSTHGCSCVGRIVTSERDVSCRQPSATTASNQIAKKEN